VVIASAAPPPTPAAVAAPARSAPTPSPETVPDRLRISPISFQDYIVRRTAVSYPAIAKIERVSGRVVIDVVIDRSGNLRAISAVSGPPLLAQSAISSVKQWSFKPYVVDGQPIEVESQIFMDFRPTP
jgi:protein TonB